MQPGKLYVMESHLCFYSEFLGETKLIFAFQEIDSVVKHSGRVEVKVGSKVHKFGKFSDLKLAYQYIRTSWLGCCPEKDSGPTHSGNEEASGDSREAPSDARSADLTQNYSRDTRSASVRSVELQVPSGNLLQSQSSSLAQMDDPLAVERSYAKYPKKEHEFARFVFPFGVEEYYNRFVGPNATFTDRTLFEVMGKGDPGTRGRMQGNPGQRLAG